MIDRLHTLIGNTARYATPKEAKELLALAAKGEGLVHAIAGMKQLCNQYLGNMVMTEDRQKEFDELLKTREELFTAIAKNKQKFTGMVQRIKWREENKGRCAYCGDEIAIKDMQIDHIRPKLRFHEGVTPDYHVDNNRNLNPACRACNNWKNIYFIEEFREQIQSQVAAARRYSRNFRMAERFKLVKETGIPVIFYYEKQKKEG